MSASDWLWLVGATGAAGTVTYFSCVRPMLPGRGGRAADAAEPAAEIAQLQAERDTLREIARLRAEHQRLLALTPPSPEHIAKS